MVGMGVFCKQIACHYKSRDQNARLSLVEILNIVCCLRRDHKKL